MLVIATIAGTVIAVLLGKFLDNPTRKPGKVLAAAYHRRPKVLEFGDERILLAPKSAPAPVEKIFEQEIVISNIGFELLENVELTVSQTYDKEFDPAEDFADHSIDSIPDGVDYQIESHETTTTLSRYSVRIPFLNRGDRLIMRTLSSSESSCSINSHMPNVEFRIVEVVENIPTLRERLARILEKGRWFEAISGALGAGVVLAALQRIM
ncbi:MAG: hypothetical protein JKZ02_06755 [Erythrobacter sp.]|nr:hypothetical protein [Erythrobacter sp.]